ncbi:T-cell surface glycoprotein CD3 delta chain-like [Plectropomus leopardus]|uniref:T-cell surface glycoprotein CD3 delta chain-like n=1 Tax=Plectropomus leopardus TaxID=160734 RepID=UPI001C4B9EAE|nr:T-cell surface glycoprotein CD3 delta chain-like [Plectropomus leopardus]
MMKCQLFFRAGLLLFWILTASVSCQEIKVSELPNGIKLMCGDKKIIKLESNTDVTELDYMDENTGVYTCTQSDDDEDIKGPKIFVKFRTCETCIELDVASVTGIVVGDVVATIMIGVAVYLIASHARTGPFTSNKKSSDRQPLFPSEVNRAPNDMYQPLQHRKKDTYDVLNNRR